ncbi:MAG: hypothetical protein FWD57_01485 [Polyangiaceae bacterium]|nr:hypothetical protein [Polyangiaceae bacterium]
MDENKRTALIADVVYAISVHDTPPQVHQAALTLVGWLARRRPSEYPCRTGVAEAIRQSFPAATDNALTPY